MEGDKKEEGLEEGVWWEITMAGETLMFLVPLTIRFVLLIPFFLQSIYALIRLFSLVILQN